MVSGPKCLWKLGCKGPYTHADCAIRRWNGYHSLCPQSGSPCISCVSPGFPDSSRPFFQEIEDVGIVGTNIDTVAKVAIGAALLAAGAHAVRRTAIKDKHEGKEEKPEEKPEEKVEKPEKKVERPEEKNEDAKKDQGEE